MRGQAPCVLVVDDDPAIRRVVALALEDEGYEVLQAADVAAAEDLLRGGRRAGVALILLDLWLPGASGAALVDSLDQQPGPRPLVLLMTAARDEATTPLVGRVDGVVAKPFDLDVLLERIRELAPAA